VKLSYLSESLNINVMKQLKIVASSLDISEEKLINIINDIDPSNKYAEWVLKQIKFKNIRVPEDNHRIKEVISQFKQHQSRLQQKDLNQYKTIHDVEAELEKFTETGSKREGAFQVNPEKLPGVKLINQDGDYKLWEVSNPESLSIMGEGTKWCTRKSYKDCQAMQYIENYQKIYIISKDSKPHIQFTKPDIRLDFMQIKDINDEDTSLSNYRSLLEPLHEDFFQRFEKYDDGSDYFAQRLSDYAAIVINGRWKKAEPIIMKNAEAAYNYARFVIKGRWPEAEPIIMQDTDIAHYYMHDSRGQSTH